MTVFLVGLRAETRRFKFRLDKVGKTFRVPVIHAYSLSDALLDERLAPDVELVAIEANRKATPLPKFTHPSTTPERDQGDLPDDVVYVVGPMNGTILDSELELCNDIVQVPMRDEHFYAPDHAAAIVLYDRMVKGW